MRRVKISIPATITNIGSGLNSLGLAINLRTNIEFSERPDNQLIVESYGVDAKHYDFFSHPTISAAMRVYQAAEHSPLGFGVRIDNTIPIDSGLGAEAAFTVAGVIGANYLIDQTPNREVVLQTASQIVGRSDGVTAAMLGGFTASLLTEQDVYYRSLSVGDMQVLIIYPTIKGYRRKADRSKPKTIAVDSVLQTIRSVPMLLDAFQRGDLHQLQQLITDHIQTPALSKHIPQYEPLREMLIRLGDSVLTLSDAGPSLVIFTRHSPQAVSSRVRSLFDDTPITIWTPTIDRQGVVITMTQST